MKIPIFVLWLTVLIFACCGINKNPLNPSTNLDVKVTKWFNGHVAALTITYDAGHPLQYDVNKILIDHGLACDYELVTALYAQRPLYLDYLKSLLPLGFGYFGHGHEHMDHDLLTYQQAYESFKHCYDLMQSWGLKTAAYAYPNSAGFEPETRLALKNAGFLASRMHMYLGRARESMINPYIVPDSAMEPSDWYALPTLVMQDYDFAKCEPCVNNNDELIPYLNETIEKTAWVMLTYHSIGLEKNYGFFKLAEFEKNVITIKQYDFWNATMNRAVLYIMERKNATVTSKITKDLIGNASEIEMTLSDGLPNDFYDQPLTLVFNTPQGWIGKNIYLFQGDSLSQTIKFDSEKAMISVLPNELSFRLGLKNR